MTEHEEGDTCGNCMTGELKWRSIHYDGYCSCHLHPPCSYCMEQELVCSTCETIHIEYAPEKYETPAPNHIKFWEQPFVPIVIGDGRITGYDYDGRSGSTMVFRGTYEGNLTNQDLLAYFGSGTFGYRFGFCLGGRFEFTKITD